MLVMELLPLDPVLLMLGLDEDDDEDDEEEVEKALRMLAVEPRRKLQPIFGDVTGGGCLMSSML